MSGDRSQRTSDVRETSPYDSCVMNKTVKKKQLTVAWQVDDLKVLRVMSKLVDAFIADMESDFGKETPLNKSRGKLRMFEVPLRGPASVLCDDQGVVKNISLVKSVLSKRRNPYTTTRSERPWQRAS